MRGIAGSTATLSLASVDAVGAFLISSLDFSPKIATAAGTNISINLSFSLTFAAQSGESLNLTLPGFRVPLAGTVAAGSIVVGGGASSALDIVMGVEEVQMRLITDVPANAAVVVTIPEAASIHLPLAGVSSDIAGVKLKSTAVAGPSSGQALAQVAAVGVFTSSRLHFTLDPSNPAAAPVAGEAAPLLLSFSLNRVIAPGERVLLLLPGFTGADVSSLPISNLTVGADFSGSWDLDTASVALEAVSGAVAGAELSLVVSSTAGIRLPSGGVTANDTAITISTNAAAGPSDPTAVLETEGVAAVSGHTLDLAGAAATVASNMTLSFTLSSPLSPGDTVSLLLPSFTGENSSSLAMATTSGGADFSGSWAAVESLVVLTAGASAAGGSPITVVIHGSNGIAIPSGGVTANTAAITLFVQGRAGSSGAVSLSAVSPVGAFFSTAVSFSPRVATVAGLEVELSLAFRASVIMSRYDLVCPLPPPRAPAGPGRGPHEHNTFVRR